MKSRFFSFSDLDLSSQLARPASGTASARINAALMHRSRKRRFQVMGAARSNFIVASASVLCHLRLGCLGAFSPLTFLVPCKKSASMKCRGLGA
jgi:hypothetical protein